MRRALEELHRRRSAATIIWHSSSTDVCWLPAQHPLRLVRTADQKVDLRRAIVRRINADKHASIFRRDRPLFFPRADPLDVDINGLEGHRREVAHGFGPASRQDERIRLRRLKDPPHALDEFAGIAPIPLRIEIAEKQAIQLPELDARDGVRDLSSDKLKTS